MEPKTLFSITIPESVKRETIVTNTLIMLSNRIFIDKNGDKQPLLNAEEARDTIDDRGDGTYIVKANNGEMYAIRIIFQKISATGKQSVISDFFRDYAHYKKIIVARDFNNKIAEHVVKHHTQIFKEASLLQNIIDHRDQPKFELLSPSEMEKVKLEYNISEYTTKKLLRSDPITKYYALRKGEIVRVIRGSPTSGEAIDYRIVM